MKKCHCGNTSFNRYGECAYCVWKGDAGVRALLKRVIKEENKKRKENGTENKKS